MRPSPLAIAVALALTTAATVGNRDRQGTSPPVRAQREPTATDFIPPSRTPTGTPQPPEACGIRIDPLVIEPRVLGPGVQASVRFTARYDFGGHSVRRRVAVVVAPIGNPLTSTVAAGLIRLAETLDLESGTELGYLPIGAAPLKITWWSGADGRRSAIEAFAQPPSSGGAGDDLRRAVDIAAAELIASPPSVAMDLLVVASGSSSTIDWRPSVVTLRDALVKRTIVDFSGGPWLSALVSDDPAGAFQMSSSLWDGSTRSSFVLAATNLFRGARARVVGVPGASWVYRIDLDADRWTSIDLNAPDGFPTSTGGGFVGRSRPIDARADAIELAFAVAPTTRLRAGLEHVVSLTDGRHSFEVRRAGGSCLAKLDFGQLCVHRQGRASEDCGAFAAALTATAQAATSTPTASPSPQPTATRRTATSLPPTPNRSATPTTAGSPTSLTTPPPTATPSAPPPARSIAYLPDARVNE